MMLTFKKLLLLMLLILALSSCKNPPDVDPCLLKIQLTPQGAIDMTQSKAFCTPVNKARAAYTLGIDKLNKFYAYSNADNATMLQWIIQNSK